MLKGIGYLLFGIGLGFMSPKFIKQYKNIKKTKTLKIHLKLLEFYY